MPNHITNTHDITCSACDQAKLHPAPHKSKIHHYAVGAYVSSDTCGPVKPTSKHGNNHTPSGLCSQQIRTRLFHQRSQRHPHPCTCSNHPYPSPNETPVERSTKRQRKRIHIPHNARHLPPVRYHPPSPHAAPTSRKRHSRASQPHNNGSSQSATPHGKTRRHTLGGCSQGHHI